MLRKLFAVLIVLIAIIVAVLGVSLARDYLSWIIRITNFFDIMLPIMLIGALINYIWKSNEEIE